MQAHLYLEHLHLSGSAIITKKSSSDIKLYPVPCVCFRQMWMNAAVWRCVCEHQGLLALRVWSGPCAGRWKQLQRCSRCTSLVSYSQAASEPNRFSLLSCRDHRLSRQRWRLTMEQLWLLLPSGLCSCPRGLVLGEDKHACQGVLQCVYLCVPVRVCEMMSEGKKK